MRHWAHFVRAAGLTLALTLSTLAPPRALAQPATTAAQSVSGGQYQGIAADAGGTLTLSSAAAPAPAIDGSYERFGTAISPTQLFSSSFRSLQIDYDARVPRGSAARVDVRASVDGARWMAWEVDVARGATIAFPVAARFAQYRVTLLANHRASPSVGAIRLSPQRGPAIFSAMDESVEPVAPTWTVHATREGLVGRNTANGHIIKKRDRFVSLPSWRALSPDGTNDYVVRITYNGRSAVAPVYDVGPWNAHDDYWNEQRERFRDLPRGYPEDHAAYFDGYNGGRAEKGRVRFPTAIDVGDGTWWDDLGINGDRAVVQVTFLWLGRDPLAADPNAPTLAANQPVAPPAPAAPAAPEQPAAAPPAPPAPPEFVVEDGGAGFAGQAKVTWYHAPGGCGSGGQALWTYTTPNPAESENVGRWQAPVPDEALYDVYAAIPACALRKPNTGSARYLVRHRDGAQEVVVDQGAGAGTWVLLGRFPFKPGDGSVELRDVTGDSMRVLWFDAVKWVRVP